MLTPEQAVALSDRSTLDQKSLEAAGWTGHTSLAIRMLHPDQAKSYTSIYDVGSVISQARAKVGEKWNDGIMMQDSDVNFIAITLCLGNLMNAGKIEEGHDFHDAWVGQDYFPVDRFNRWCEERAEHIPELQEPDAA